MIVTFYVNVIGDDFGMISILCMRNSNCYMYIMLMTKLKFRTRASCGYFIQWRHRRLNHLPISAVVTFDVKPATTLWASKRISRQTRKAYNALVSRVFAGGAGVCNSGHSGTTRQTWETQTIIFIYIARGLLNKPLIHVRIRHIRTFRQHESLALYMTHTYVDSCLRRCPSVRHDTWHFSSSHRHGTCSQRHTHRSPNFHHQRCRSGHWRVWRQEVLDNDWL